jgi:hypothetical protein
VSAFSWMEHPASFFGWAVRIIAPPNDSPFTWKLRLIECRVPAFSRARYVSSREMVEPTQQAQAETACLNWQPSLVRVRAGVDVLIAHSSTDTAVFLARACLSCSVTMATRSALDTWRVSPGRAAMPEG